MAGGLQANGQLRHRAIIITLCEEEVLGDLASFTRHPGKLLGGNEISAGAEECVEVEGGGGRKWERPGSWQLEQLG